MITDNHQARKAQVQASIGGRGYILMDHTIYCSQLTNANDTREVLPSREHVVGSQQPPTSKEGNLDWGASILPLKVGLCKVPVPRLTEGTSRGPNWKSETPKED